MINDNTILSSFDDRPTLLEWLKKVEDALKTDTATAVSVENPSANTYVFKITFADGKTLSSGNVVFPDSVKDVSIKNGHIIVTSVGGNVEDLGVLNPYAETIVENAVTNTTEIRNNVEVGGKLEVSGDSSVTGNATLGGNLGVTGQAVVGGRLQVNSSIISNGEIRGGNISGTKFLLGTEEMPLVKANPTGEATQTLEKVKIGDVAYNVGGGGGGGSVNEREITFTMPYPSGDATPDKKIYVEEEIWNKITNCYYETIKIYYNDGNPLGVFHPLNLKDSDNNINSKRYACVSDYKASYSTTAWYGNDITKYWFAYIMLSSNSTGKFFRIYGTQPQSIPQLNKETFDRLYKLADKPTQDGNYILKASVSGGAVTYTWELQQ